jgi:protease I
VIAAVFAVPALGNTVGDAADRKAKGMAGTLQGNRTTLATDGVEQAELVQPRKAVTDDGARVQIVSLSEGEIQAMDIDIEPAEKFTADVAAAKASADDYDALLTPGGPVNGDRPRMDFDVRQFVTEIFRAGKPVGVLCHGDTFRAKIVEEFAECEHKVHDQGGAA